MVIKVPINCPFCDEPAYPKKKSYRVVMPHTIFTLRECPMGHQFYSVEEVPEDQSAIVDRIKKYKHDKYLARRERFYAKHAKSE
jgi:hypothetical protein